MIRKTQTYKSLPCNDALKDKAKALRKAGFLHGALLWNQLKSKNFNGLDFDRQNIIGNYIVDFYCADKTVVIEVDGGSHNNTWIRGLNAVYLRFFLIAPQNLAFYLKI